MLYIEGTLVSAQVEHREWVNRETRKVEAADSPVALVVNQGKAARVVFRTGYDIGAMLEKLGKTVKIAVRSAEGKSGLLTCYGE